MGFAMLKYAIAPAVNKNQDEKLVQSLLENSRKYFLPNAERFIGAVNF